MFASHSKSKSKSKSKKDLNKPVQSNNNPRKISQKKSNGTKKYLNRDKSSNKISSSDLISPKTIDYSKCNFEFNSSD